LSKQLPLWRSQPHFPNGRALRWLLCSLRRACGCTEASARKQSSTDHNHG
jgi:hypothetical protein